MAFMAAMKGYKMVLTMPSYTSIERRVTMKVFGADLVITDPTKGMGGTVKKAYDLLESTPNGFMLQQFSNPANTQVCTFFPLKSLPYVYLQRLIFQWIPTGTRYILRQLAPKYGKILRVTSTSLLWE